MNEHLTPAERRAEAALASKASPAEAVKLAAVDRLLDDHGISVSGYPEADLVELRRRWPRDDPDPRWRP